MGGSKGKRLPGTPNTSCTIKIDDREHFRCPHCHRKICVSRGDVWAIEFESNTWPPQSKAKKKSKKLRKKKSRK